MEEQNKLTIYSNLSNLIRITILMKYLINILKKIMNQIKIKSLIIK